MKKTCSLCKKVKDISEFNLQKDKKSGFCSQCKVCKKLYYEENKEKISARCKKHRENNKDVLAAKAKQYYDKNKNIILMKKKQYYIMNKKQIDIKARQYHYDNREIRLIKAKQYWKVNREKLCIYKKQYRKINKEAISKKKINYSKKQANYLTHHEKLTVDESPRLAQDSVSLEVKCRYCGKYFIPTNYQITSRTGALNGQLPGENSLYCSDNCKESCPIYKQVKYPKGFKPASSREVNPLVRQLCFERDNWKCQICGASQKEAPLHCHHVEGYAQNPRLGNDIANVITLCKACHKEVHKLPGCNYYELQCKKD